MDAQDWSLRQGHRLLQVGMLLFLFALLVGLAVPHFAVPRLGLSTHLLGIMQALFLMVTGLVWPRLALPRALSRVGSWLAICGCLAAWAANLFAGMSGSGNTMLPIAAGQAHGSPLQEGIIAIGLRTAAVSLIAVSLPMGASRYWLRPVGPVTHGSGSRRPNSALQRTRTSIVAWVSKRWARRSCAGALAGCGESETTGPPAGMLSRADMQECCSVSVKVAPA